MVDFRISITATRPLPSRRKQALRKDIAESLGKAVADALLVFHGESTDDALDGFSGVGGVQCGKNKVAGFRGLESNFHGFAVAHFADEDNFGSLPQGGTKGEREGGCVAVERALVNRRLLVAMQEFDGVLDGEDVHWLFFVHLVDDRRERGRLARAVGPVTSTMPFFRLQTSAICGATSNPQSWECDLELLA